MWNQRSNNHMSHRHRLPDHPGLESTLLMLGMHYRHHHLSQYTLRHHLRHCNVLYHWLRYYSHPRRLYLSLHHPYLGIAPCTVQVLTRNQQPLVVQNHETNLQASSHLHYFV
ncbi:hypothetical protein GECvBMG_gp018c [Salmonella phage GEC_vB_MG]|nr:hypothetical protein GECvBMG_gp018c [Salmonella phage GEC_vB_MG]